MAYVDAFIAAVPTANKNQYIAHATEAGRSFKQHGAIQYVECWGDEVPDGEVTSMPMAVKCRADETVCFGWVVWPSREARDAGMQQVMQEHAMDPAEMPFDGMRLIYGSFEPIVEL